MELEKKNKDSYRVGQSSKGEIYRLKISDHILDNIYGQIGLTEVEKQIERLSIFKRLHNISQLGLVNWIFPCALHTRYTHSIGVMHIADQMAERINQNMRHQYDRSPFFDDDEIQIIRLAGMLHDIGHYPLSHNVEQAYKDISKKKKAQNTIIKENLDYHINCPHYLCPDHITSSEASNEKKDFNTAFRGSQGLHHESIGKSIISKNKELHYKVKWYFVLIPSSDGTEWVLNPKFYEATDDNVINDKVCVADVEVDRIVQRLMLDIGNIVIGNYQASDGQNPWSQKYSAMVQIIHSELDADNLDYLVRDATFSGTSYGIMDMSLLLNCLTVGEMKWASVNDKQVSRYLVGIKKKGLVCVEQFLMNKFFAYTQMILSKYTSILEAMLLYLQREIVDSNIEDYNSDILESLVNSPETSPMFLQFADYYVFNFIFNKSKCNDFTPFANASVSCLNHFCAFNLADDDSECICVGTDLAEIQKEMGKSNVYKKFSAVYDTLKERTGAYLLTDYNSEQSLLSFRFEQYFLTKQLPLSLFLKDLINVQLKTPICQVKCNTLPKRTSNGVRQPRDFLGLRLSLFVN